MAQTLLPTTVVGSYPQPDWLVNREMLSKSVPRVRMNIWRVPEPWLEQAQDDATIVAIRDMERAGIDIITDGEIRRESYSNRFGTALEGLDLAKPGHVKARSGHETPVPRVVGKIRRTRAVEVRDMRFLRANTDRIAKITLPGPFTLSQQAINEFYKDADEMVMDYAVAVNAEAHDLVAAGADIIQLDEPWLRNDPDAAKRIAVKAINRALEGLKVPTIVHLCFGYAALVPGETKPVGYSFLPQLADTTADQISIEAAQPKLDLGVLKELAPKKILLGVLDLAEPGRRDAAGGGRPHPRGAEARARRQADPGARLRHEISAPRHRLRQAEGHGGRRRHRAQRAVTLPCWCPALRRPAKMQRRACLTCRSCAVRGGGSQWSAAPPKPCILSAHCRPTMAPLMRGRRSSEPASVSGSQMAACTQVGGWNARSSASTPPTMTWPTTTMVKYGGASSARWWCNSSPQFGHASATFR